jgi:hypothetical protein
MAPALKRLESARSVCAQALAEGLSVSAIFDLMGAGLDPSFAKGRTRVTLRRPMGSGERALRESGACIVDWAVIT